LGLGAPLVGIRNTPIVSVPGWSHCHHLLYPWNKLDKGVLAVMVLKTVTPFLWVASTLPDMSWRVLPDVSVSLTACRIVFTLSGN